jgi:thymidylate synthase (FAD)
MKIIEPSVELLWITPQPESQIEIAGRTCYKSEDKITPESSGKFVAQMYKRGHHAMIEHAAASFRIITDRGISHEIVRHRIASYAQESTRYCNYLSTKFGKECSFVEPSGLNDHQKMLWVRACIGAEMDYFDMLEAGCPAQTARSVLPTCTKTELVMTANLREWMHFIKLREDKTAHPDIRPIARMVRVELAKHAPNIFKGEEKI